MAQVGLELAPLHVPPAYEHVANRLRRAIWLGELIPGERLPSERALAEGLEVSRLTIREALRTLQGEGLITIRRGASGGATIALSEPSAEQRHRLLVEARDHMRDVHEVRQAIEPMAARLAAERITDGQLAALRAHQDEIFTTTGVSSFRRTDSAFHMTIAQASGNPLLAKAVEDARSALFVMFDTSNFEVLKASSGKAHQKILDAIAVGNGDEAAALMSVHLAEAWAEIEAVIDSTPGYD